MSDSVAPVCLGCLTQFDSRLEDIENRIEVHDVHINKIVERQDNLDEAANQIEGKLNHAITVLARVDKESEIMHDLILELRDDMKEIKEALLRNSKRNGH